MNTAIRRPNKPVARTVIVLAISCAVAAVSWHPSAGADETAATRPSSKFSERHQIRLPAVLAAPMVQIRAPMDGKLKAITVAEGQNVHKQGVMFQFDDTREQTALQLARVRFDSAHRALQHVEEGYKTGSFSQSDVDKATEALETAKIQVETCEEDILDTTVTSPLDGTVTEYSVVPGQYLPKGTLLTTIVDTRIPKVEFNLPADMIASLHVEGECKVYLQTRPDGDSWNGKITYIAPSVSSVNGTVRVKAAIGSHDPRLKPGMPVIVEFYQH